MSSRWDLDQTRSRVTGAQRYREIDECGVQLNEVTLPITFDIVATDEVYALADKAGFVVRELFGNYDGAAFDPAISPFALFLLQAR